MFLTFKVILGLFAFRAQHVLVSFCLNYDSEPGTVNVADFLNNSVIQLFKNPESPTSVVSICDRLVRMYPSNLAWIANHGRHVIFSLNPDSCPYGL